MSRKAEVRGYIERYGPDLDDAWALTKDVEKIPRPPASPKSALSISHSLLEMTQAIYANANREQTDSIHEFIPQLHAEFSLTVQ